jgi:hypothetical protein
MPTHEQNSGFHRFRKGLAILLIAGLVPAAFAAPDSVTVSGTDTTLWFQGSIRDLPGWVPPADPESASVRIGRRLNAPVVDIPYTNGLGSVDEVAQTFVKAICAGDADTLYNLCITYDELKDIMWLEFPQSRPITNLTADDAWMFLNARNTSGINSACKDYLGRDLRLLRVERRDTVMVFKNFNLHRGLTLVVENERGEEEKITNLRTVAERKGVYKIYSMKD